MADEANDVTSADTPPASPEPAADSTTSTAPPVEPVSASDSEPAAADAKEPPKPPTEPATDKETAYGRAVRKREVALVQERTRFQAERAAVESEKTAIAKERAEAQRLIALAKEDPLRFAQEHAGYRDEDIARRFLNNGKPAPQELEARRDAEIKAALKERDDRIEALQKTIEEHVVAPRRQQQAQEVATKTKADFTGFAASAATKFPHAAAMFAKDADDALDEANEIAVAMRASGPVPQDRDAFWEKVLERQNARAAKRAGASAPAASQGATKGLEKQGQQGTPADGGTNASTTAPTLTGKGASQRGTIPREDDPLLDVIDPKAGRARTEKAIEKALEERNRAAASH